MKKLLALLLLSPLVSGEDDVISLICKYEEGSQIRISNIYKWSTSYFADEKVTINILPSKKIATIMKVLGNTLQKLSLQKLLSLQEFQLLMEIYKM